MVGTRLRPDAGQGDRPRARRARRPPAGSRSRSSALHLGGRHHQPRLPRRRRCATRPSWPATPPPTSSSGSRRPPRSPSTTPSCTARRDARPRSGSRAATGPTRAVLGVRSRAAGATPACPTSAIAFARRGPHDRGRPTSAQRDGRFRVGDRDGTARVHALDAGRRSTSRSTGAAPRRRVTRDRTNGCTCRPPAAPSTLDLVPRFPRPEDRRAGGRAGRARCPAVARDVRVAVGDARRRAGRCSWCSRR